MNYYAMETQMFDRQKEMLHDADRRRLVAASHARPEGKAVNAPNGGILAATAGFLRSLLVAGRSARIEHPEFGDAS